MADRYAYARSRTVAKLREFNTGVVTLTRETRGPSDVDSRWIPGPVTATVVYTLDARIDGVTADQLDPDSTITATDLVAIVSPLARDGAAITPQMTDKLTVDGAEKVIKKIEAVPAAGPPARFHIFMAS